MIFVKSSYLPRTVLGKVWGLSTVLGKSDLPKLQAGLRKGVGEIQIWSSLTIPRVGCFLGWGLGSGGII